MSRAFKRVPRWIMFLFVIGVLTAGALIGRTIFVLFQEGTGDVTVNVQPTEEIQVPITILMPTVSQAGMGAPAPTVTPEATTKAYGQGIGGTPTPSANGEPVRFVPDAEGYKLYVDSGVTYYGEQTHGRWDPWVGPSRLLVTWLSQAFDGERVHDGYLLNLDSGRVERLPGFRVHMQAYAREDGKKAVLLDLNNDGGPPRIYVSNIETGEVQTVYDLDADVAQWAGEEMRPKDQELSISNGTALWAGQEAFVVDVSPGLRPPAGSEGTEEELPRWEDTLLLVDIISQRVHMVQGFLAGVLPDGSVLISHDTAMGEELEVHTPPYDDAPVTISQPGVWISSVQVGSDGRNVAWIESEPPSPDFLDDQHMLCFEGCRFQPKPLAVAFWETGTGRIRKVALGPPGLDRVGQDLYDLRLQWSRDGHSVFYSGLGSDGGTQPYRIGMDGSVTALDAPKIMVRAETRSNPWVAGEGADGTIYFAGAASYYDSLPLIVRRPDGTMEALAGEGTGAPASMWMSGGSGHLLLLREDGVEVLNMESGESRLVRFPTKEVFKEIFGNPLREVVLSKDGKWLAYSGWDDDQYMSLDTQEPGLAMRIVKVR
jgi:hypothetical protein